MFIFLWKCKRLSKKCKDGHELSVGPLQSLVAASSRLSLDPAGKLLYNVWKPRRALGFAQMVFVLFPDLMAISVVQLIFDV